VPNTDNRFLRGKAHLHAPSIDHEHSLSHNTQTQLKNADDDIDRQVRMELRALESSFEGLLQHPLHIKCRQFFAMSAAYAQRSTSLNIP
jgi:hypothetical protein